MWQVVLLGAMAGWHAANWGAYKDVPYEGFGWVSYLRSVVVGATAALLLGAVLLPDALPPLLVVLGVVYAFERLGTEWWKSILREDDQSAYSIPMRLGVRGRTIERRALRYATGAGVVVALAVLCAVGAVLQDGTNLSPVLTVLLGGVGGWLTAVGGAWKDAPVEGFSGWKFLRSPAVATGWALPLSTMTTDWVLLAFSAAGFAVASIETYKTFLTGGRPPGKFAGKEIRFAAPLLRGWFAFLHAALWSALGLGVVISIARDRAVEPAGGAVVIAVAAAVAAIAVVIAVPWDSFLGGGSARALRRPRVTQR